MYVGKILYIIDKMKKNHAVPNIIDRMDMMRKLRKILLGIDYLLRNLQFFEMLAFNMLILTPAILSSDIPSSFEMMAAS